MSTLLNLLMVVQILSALGMIGLILVQHGKGADMGAAFGSGTSGSLFGASGGANFLSRTTAVLAAVFFVCTLAQAYFGNLRTAPTSEGSVLERAQPVTPPRQLTKSLVLYRRPQLPVPQPRVLCLRLQPTVLLRLKFQVNDFFSNGYSYLSQGKKTCFGLR